MNGEKIKNEELAEKEAKEAFDWYCKESDRIHEKYYTGGLDGNNAKYKKLSKELTQKLNAIREKYNIRLDNES